MRSKVLCQLLAMQYAAHSTAIMLRKSVHGAQAPVAQRALHKHQYYLHFVASMEQPAARPNFAMPSVLWKRAVHAAVCLDITFASNSCVRHSSASLMPMLAVSLR